MSEVTAIIPINCEYVNRIRIRQIYLERKPRKSRADGMNKSLDVGAKRLNRKGRTYEELVHLNL